MRQAMDFLPSPASFARMSRSNNSRRGRGKGNTRKYRLDLRGHPTAGKNAEEATRITKERLREEL